MKNKKITREKVDVVVASLTGLPISRMWRDSSTIFFELGTLRPHTNLKGKDSPRGEITLMIGGGWRFEKPQSIWLGTFSDRSAIDAKLPQLVGHTIEAATLEGRLPELSLELSDKIWFRSFECEEGTQDWVIFTSDYAYYAEAQSFYQEPVKS